MIISHELLLTSMKNVSDTLRMSQTEFGHIKRCSEESFHNLFRLTGATVYTFQILYTFYV
jgi:hypothetical protein